MAAPGNPVVASTRRVSWERPGSSRPLDESIPEEEPSDFPAQASGTSGWETDESGGKGGISSQSGERTFSADLSSLYSSTANPSAGNPSAGNPSVDFSTLGSSTLSIFSQQSTMSAEGSNGSGTGFSSQRNYSLANIPEKQPSMTFDKWRKTGSLRPTTFQMSMSMNRSMLAKRGQRNKFRLDPSKSIKMELSRAERLHRMTASLEPSERVLAHEDITIDCADLTGILKDQAGCVTLKEKRVKLLAARAYHDVAAASPDGVVTTHRLAHALLVAKKKQRQVPDLQEVPEVPVPAVNPSKKVGPSKNVILFRLRRSARKAVEVLSAKILLCCLLIALVMCFVYGEKGYKASGHGTIPAIVGVGYNTAKGAAVCIKLLSALVLLMVSRHTLAQISRLVSWLLGRLRKKYMQSRTPRVGGVPDPPASKAEIEESRNGKDLEAQQEDQANGSEALKRRLDAPGWTFPDAMSRFVAFAFPLIDNAIPSHKILGMLLFLFSWIHSVAHIFNNLRLYDYSTISSSGLVSPLTLGYIYGTQVMVTGVVLLILISSIPFLAWFINRAKMYDVFLGTHLILAMSYYGILLFHAPPWRGYWGPLKPENYPSGPGYKSYSTTWMWVIVPLCLYIPERLFRLTLYWTNPYSAQLLPDSAIRNPAKKRDQSKVLTLKLTYQGRWKPKVRPGQHVFILAPNVSLVQWHPFSVSAYSIADGGATLILQIERVPDRSGRPEVLTWTGQLGMMENEPRILVDGPFNGPFTSIFKHYQTLVLAATNTGVTPFISLIQYIRESTKYQFTVYFYWICREKLDPLEWEFLATLGKYMLENKDNPEKSKFHVNIYLGSEVLKKNKTQLILDYYSNVLEGQPLTQPDQESGWSEDDVEFMFPPHAGRPNWKQEFDYVKSSVKGLSGKPEPAGKLEAAEDLEAAEELPVKTVGVFAVGAAIVGELQSLCTEKSDPQILFDFVTEHYNK